MDTAHVENNALLVGDDRSLPQRTPSVCMALDRDGVRTRVGGSRRKTTCVHENVEALMGHASLLGVLDLAHGRRSDHFDPLLTTCRGCR